MCTVTFIPAKDTYYITSNRDERSNREQAMPPLQYTYGDVSIIYPKDREAGGSWIAMRNDGCAAVLLNGAFIKHVPAPPYKKSRGIIFLQIITHKTPVKKYLQIDLDKIEPFTLIILDNGNLYECRWNGSNKYCRQLASGQPHIWSSATLYTRGVVNKREKWFKKWLEKNPDPSQDDIIRFHHFAGDGDQYNDLRMNRDGKLLTVSVTGIELNSKKSSMIYLDLKDNTEHKLEMQARFLPWYCNNILLHSH